ncbi:MAG: ERF family protein [Collinsella sp.]
MSCDGPDGETDTLDPSALFTQLLAEAQAEMVNPPKSKTGQKGYQTYSYSPLDLVLNIIRPPLNKRGIFFTSAPRSPPTARACFRTPSWPSAARNACST